MTTPATKRLHVLREEIAELCRWLAEYTLTEDEERVWLPNGVLAKEEGAEELAQLLAARYGGEVVVVRLDPDEGIERTFAMVGPRSRFLVDFARQKVVDWSYIFDLCDPRELEEVLDIYGPVEDWEISPAPPAETILYMPKDYDVGNNNQPATVFDDHFVARTRISSGLLEAANLKGFVGGAIRHGGLYYSVTLPGGGLPQPIPTAFVQSLKRVEEQKRMDRLARGPRPFLLSVYHRKLEAPVERIEAFDPEQFVKVAEVRVTKTPLAALEEARRMVQQRANPLTLAGVIATAACAKFHLPQPENEKEWMIPQGDGVTRLVPEEYRFARTVGLVLEREGEFFAYERAPLEDGDGYHVIPTFQKVPVLASSMAANLLPSDPSPGQSADAPSL